MSQLGKAVESTAIDELVRHICLGWLRLEGTSEDRHIPFLKMSEMVRSEVVRWVKKQEGDGVAEKKQNDTDTYVHFLGL